MQFKYLLDKRTTAWILNWRKVDNCLSCTSRQARIPTKNDKAGNLKPPLTKS